DRPAQGGDRAAGSRHRQEAGDAIGGGSVLQEIAAPEPTIRHNPWQNRCNLTPRLNRRLSFPLYYNWCPSSGHRFASVHSVSRLYVITLSRRQRRLLF